MTLCTSLCLCSILDHIFKLIPRWSIMYIQIYIHIPNHCCVPVTVIPKVQMIPVFLWHVDNDTGEKIKKPDRYPNKCKMIIKFQQARIRFSKYRWLSPCRTENSHFTSMSWKQKKWAERLHGHIKNLGWGGIISKALEIHETA